ncbi:hypothetical protein HpBT060_14840 [Helicobacter pylori]
MDLMGKKWFKFRSVFNQFELGFLNSREYGLLFVLLSALSGKGDKAVNVDKRYIVKMFNSNLSYVNLNSLLISLKQKLTDNGFIGNGDKALFSVFDLENEKKGIARVSVKLQKSRLYLVNNVNNNYSTIDLFKLNSMPCFGAKVVYCWINQYKKAGSFIIKADKLLSVLDVNTSDSCNLGVRFKRIIKALHGIGYEVEIIKEKKGLDARRISALRFNFKEIKQVKTNQANPSMLPKLKQDAPMISGAKTNQAKTPTPFKLNDALTRFKDSIKKLNDAKANPTIHPTVKNANNKQIQANNETWSKIENIVLTSPKYFDFKINSVTKGSLYYEIKAFCDLKKKHECIKLLVSEYSNPLDYFYKQGYKFKRYEKQESDADFEKYTYRIVSLTHSDEKYGDITSYLKIMRIFKRYDDKIQVELKDVDKEGVVIKPFIAENEKHLNAWFNKYQFGSY